jgi:hypothetical protein
MGTALEDSWQSVEVVADEAKAEGLMEKIIGEYVDRMNDNHATALSIIAGRETSYESDSDYGMPVTMEYIVFDSNGAEQPDTAGQNRNLKVTVESPGENLTTILSQSRTSSNQSWVPY